jgi:hypothetical protein
MSLHRAASRFRWPLALACALGCAACGTPNRVPPEDAARTWSEKLKIPFRGVACTTVDSDDDGYVSCVLSIDRGDAVPIYQGLQCAELGTTKAGGCKPDAKNPKVDIVDWKSGMPTCPPCPECASPRDGGR